MQPDLPWNVAGIPPEAREAARASARREGLSVGEWLTRRILRSLSDSGEQQPAYRAEVSPSQAARDSAAMLDSVSRSEAESGSAYRRIEEQLRGVSRRLETAERSQVENGRAMNKAATEINIATREQAQAFDQLGAHVVSLSDRLGRVEQQAAQDGLKDAVRALHQGLSRVADQISQTANHSADQLAILAGNVEAVAGRLGESRAEAESTSRTLEQRIAMIDERVRAVDRAANTSADALERTIANIEKTQGDRNISATELQRQAAMLAQLTDTLDRLTTRFSASEAQTAGAMARLEENVARLDAKGQDALLDRRLLGIEHALSDIAGRLEDSERSSDHSNVEESMRQLAQRVDAADKRHRDALTELRTAVKDANGSLATYDDAPQTAVQTPFATASGPQSAGQPILDLPPFPEPAFQPSLNPQASDAFVPPPSVFEPPPEPFGPLRNFADDTFASATQPMSGNESFLAAARRSAKSAAAAADAVPASSTFSWGARRSNEATNPSEAPKSNTLRYVLIVGIAIIAVIAVAAGVMLSQMGGHHPVRVPPNVNEILHPKPAVQPTTQTYTPPLGASDDEGEATTKTLNNITASPSATLSKPVKVVPAPVKSVPDTALPAPQPTPQQTVLSPARKLAALAGGGNVKAQAILGFSYLDGTNGLSVNEAEGARWLERAANGGDAMSAYRLGTLYERGHGVPADAAKANQLYGIAAKQGNRKAMHNLAVAFAEGSGVPKNLQQASQWFTKAAEMGLSDSQFNLAVLYERGMGVPQSLTEAFKWYSIAAAQGDAESKARVDALATQLTPAEKATAQAAVQNFHPKPMNPAANTAPMASAIGG